MPFRPPRRRFPRPFAGIVSVACVSLLLGACEGEFAPCVPDGGDTDAGETACNANPDSPDLQLCRRKCAHVAECTQAAVAPSCAEDCVTIIQTADVLGDPDQRPLFECEASIPCDQLPTCPSP